MPPGEAAPILHCWMGRREWVEETFGYLSDEYIADAASSEGSATCLLPDGHDGPHEFTPDESIIITFGGSDAAG